MCVLFLIKLKKKCLYKQGFKRGLQLQDFSHQTSFLRVYSIVSASKRILKTFSKLFSNAETHRAYSLYLILKPYFIPCELTALTSTTIFDVKLTNQSIDRLQNPAILTNAAVVYWNNNCYTIQEVQTLWAVSRVQSTGFSV